jgi:hypothetical protein
MIKKDTLDTLDNFVNRGWPPGSFCQAVLENNLMEAFGRADEENREALFWICDYVYNELPMGCHGSPEKVARWYDVVSQAAEK